MKFKKKLSNERISLLSPQDRKIYESEWNTKPVKEWSIFESPDDFSEFSEDECLDDMTVSEEIDYKKIADEIVSEEMSNLYTSLFSDMMTEQEFEKMKSDILSDDGENYDINDNVELITEAIGAEGQDAYAWIRGLKLGWLGKLVAGGLGLLGTGLAALIAAGRDKAAIKKLKNFMNRIVEVTDMGIHKKRPWYSFLIPSKEKRNNIGEYNIGCFRTIQETADRNMTNAVMQAAHRLGYFKSGDMMNISNGAGPQPGGGLDAFKNNVLNQLYAIAYYPNSENYAKQKN
jgi:hypothetical protein